MQMLQNVAVAVFMVWLMIDGLVVFRRKSSTAENRDRFSLRVVAGGNLLALATGIWLAYEQIGVIRPTLPAQVAGFIILGLGIAIRSIAVAQLGRLHTPNVAVLVDHEVVDRGLYRHI